MVMVSQSGREFTVIEAHGSHVTESQSVIKKAK